MHRIDAVIQEFQENNAVRNAYWDLQKQLTPLFFSTELAGEVGEACNVVKKLERERLGLRGSRATLDDLKKELEDVIICAVLLANSYDIKLTPTEKFNETSRKLNLPEIK